MNNESPENTWTDEARAYWGDELVQMSDAQNTGSIDSASAQITSLETPEGVHQYILDELGDTELALRIAEHPEITAEVVEGAGLPSPDFFGMLRAIAKKNLPLAESLAREAQHNGRLLKSTVHFVQGAGTTTEDREQFSLEHHLGITESATTVFSVKEKRKTAFDEQVIGYVNDEMQKLRESFGLPEHEVISEQVRLLDESAFAPKILGRADMYKQVNLVSQSEGESPLHRASIIIHELAHAHAYGAIEIARDENGLQKVYIRRRGLNVRDSKKNNGEVFLDGLNEAVTEELANRIAYGIEESHPQLGELSRVRKNWAKKQLDENPKFFGRYNRPHWYTPDANGDSASSGYTEERCLMYYLFRKMYSTAPERFGDVTQEEADEELFAMLTKGAFTGNILPFGRLFNDTFGRGKFREFAHLQTIEEQKAFIDAL